MSHNLYGFLENDGINHLDYLGLTTESWDPYTGKDDKQREAEEQPPENPDRPIDGAVSVREYNCAGLAFRTYTSHDKHGTQKILTSQCRSLDTCDIKCEDPRYCVKMYYWTYTIQEWWWEFNAEGDRVGSIQGLTDKNFHIVGGKSKPNGDDADNACSTALDEGFHTNPKSPPRGPDGKPSGKKAGHPSDFKPRPVKQEPVTTPDGRIWQYELRLDDFHEKCYCCPETIQP